MGGGTSWKMVSYSADEKTYRFEELLDNLSVGRKPYERAPV
jgi:hypothetical protein